MNAFHVQVQISWKKKSDFIKMSNITRYSNIPNIMKEMRIRTSNESPLWLSAR